MMNRWTSKIFILATGFLALFPTLVPACSVCFGDPESPMTHGAKAGIIFMIVLIYGVLFSIAGLVGFWIYRARQINLAAQSEQSQA